jgi:hypothetical protein
MKSIANIQANFSLPDVLEELAIMRSGRSQMKA